MPYRKIVILALWNAATLAIIDLESYSKARQAWAASPDRPPPKFDWQLFLSRITKGLITGALAGAGIDAAAAAIP